MGPVVHTILINYHVLFVLLRDWLKKQCFLPHIPVPSMSVAKCAPRPLV